MSAGRAAAAARAVQQTGIPIAVVLLVCDGVPAQRMIISADGAVEGSLRNSSLDEQAVAFGREALESGRASSRIINEDDNAILLYADVHTPVERLLVVGAGHIAVPLAALGVMLDFEVTVLDDRAEFATEERFADGVRVLRADFVADPFADVVIDERTYITLVTRGHMWDFDCLTRVLNRDVLPRYIGMIGSRRRVRAAFDALNDAGVTTEKMKRIHAPIGLDINADSPAEIAVSIAAEIVAVRRSPADRPAAADRHAVTLTQKERVLERLWKTWQ
ncbi:MAG TPA: XdhC family protein [Longimicrobiales bacterium]